MPGERSGAVNRCLPARILPIENVFTRILRAFPEIYDRQEWQSQLVSQPSGSRRQTPLCGCPSFGIGECVMVFVWYFTPPSSPDWHLFLVASRSLSTRNKRDQLQRGIVIEFQRTTSGTRRCVSLRTWADSDRACLSCCQMAFPQFQTLQAVWEKVMEKLQNPSSLSFFLILTLEHRHIFSHLVRPDWPFFCEICQALKSLLGTKAHSPPNDYPNTKTCMINN